MTYGIEDEVWAEIEDSIKKTANSERVKYDREAMARILMVELVRAEIAEVVLLKHDFIRVMWDEIVSSARKKVEDRRRKERMRRLKISGASKLTAEERRLFKIPDPENIS